MLIFVVKINEENYNDMNFSNYNKLKNLCLPIDDMNQACMVKTALDGALGIKKSLNLGEIASIFNRNALPVTVYFLLDNINAGLLLEIPQGYTETTYDHLLNLWVDTNVNKRLKVTGKIINE